MKKKYSWIKSGIEDADIALMKKLNKMNSHGVYVWLMALKTTLRQSDDTWTIDAQFLYSLLVCNHTSHDNVKEILIASGDFAYDEQNRTFYLVPSALLRYLNIRVADVEQSENSRVAQGEQSEKTRVAPSSLTPARLVTPASTSDKEIKEKEMKMTEYASSSSSSADSSTKSKEQMIGRLSEGPENQHWREVCIMNHPLLKNELQDDLPWCLSKFIDWALTNGNDRVLFDIGEAKRYFNNFCNNPNTSDRLKHEFQSYRARQSLSPEELEHEEKFDEEMQRHFPHVAMMAEPLTFAQYRELRKKYPARRLQAILLQMDNDKNLFQARSALQSVRERVKREE